MIEKRKEKAAGVGVWSPRDHGEYRDARCNRDADVKSPLVGLFSVTRASADPYRMLRVGRWHRLTFRSRTELEPLQFKSRPIATAAATHCTQVEIRPIAGSSGRPGHKGNGPCLECNAHRSAFHGGEFDCLIDESPPPPPRIMGNAQQLGTVDEELVETERNRRSVFTVDGHGNAFR